MTTTTADAWAAFVNLVGNIGVLAVVIEVAVRVGRSEAWLVWGGLGLFRAAAMMSAHIAASRGKGE